MRVAIYARVSTKDQSCEMQLRDLRAYCAARGYSEVTEFVETGVSGAKRSRPQLDQMMALVRKRKADVVLCWRFDRMARSSAHLTRLLEEFRGLGVAFISYMENLDTQSPMGQAMFTIISAMAQLERDLTIERITAGVQNARAKGKRLGRPPRYIDIEKFQELRDQGLGLNKIADRLGVGCGTLRQRLAHLGIAAAATREATQ